MSEHVAYIVKISNLNPPPNAERNGRKPEIFYKIELARLAKTGGK